MTFKLDRELYLTEDKKTVVEAGDPRARFVLGVEGSEIPDEQAEELGLVKISRKATKPLVQETAEVEPEEVEEPKAKESAQNKAAATKANKGK